MKKIQDSFFEALKQIKDKNIEIYSSYLNPSSRLNSTILKNEYKHLQNKLNTKIDMKCFKKIQSELVESVIYEIMELFDGYGNLDFEVDIIEKNTKTSLREERELHDSFINYITNHDGK